MQRSGTCRVMVCLAAAVAATALSPGVSAQVVINEVMAANGSIILPNNDVTDFVELYNPSASSVSLENWSLTDTPLNPRRFVFPAGVSVPANGYLLIYCDSETNSGGIHTLFGLDRDGSYVGLYTPTNVLQDSLTFGFQVEDYSLGRHPSSNGDFTLCVPTPEGSNEAAPLGESALLKINEWMPIGVSAKGGSIVIDDDWFEIYNPDTNIVALGGMVLKDNSIVRTPVRSFSYLAASGFVRFFANDSTNRANEVNFKLSSTSGDEIYIFQPDGSNVIDHIAFGPTIATNSSQGRLPDGSTNIVMFPYNRRTPGDSNLVPLTNSVVINEALAHTDPPLEDAIELYNPTARSIDIGLWWLTNQKGTPYKYQIPAGVVIPPKGFKVFYEIDFDPDDTGDDPSFRLNSAHGDHVYLFQANASGALTGYLIGETMDPSANGVSQGRYVTSDGKADFVPMRARTFGQDNPISLAQFRNGTGLPNPASPLVGPLVINEIMYHPPDVVVGFNRIDDNTNEFVEILNISATNVFLFDPNVYSDGLGRWADGHTNTWRLRGTVDFEFPTNVVLAPGKTLLAVNFDPTEATNTAAAFRAKYDIPSNVRLFGPYRGKLSNGGGTVELQRPDPPQSRIHPDFRFVPHIPTDRVKYKDTTPWPVAADGFGKSLQRRVASDYGDDPANWVALNPSAGRLNPVSRPVITTQPHSVTAVPGTNVVFEVVATGSQPLEYQWYFESVPLGNETNTTLALNLVMSPNAGSYSVVVSNFMGSVTSRAAVLTIDCGYALTPGAVSFPAAGGVTNIFVFAGVGCEWTASSDVPWIKISDTGATNVVGANVFTFSVESNPVATIRKGKVTVGPKTLIVTQYAADLTVPRLSITAPLNGASTRNSSLTIRGVASDNAEVTAAELSVNGGPWQAAAPLPQSTRRVWYWKAEAELEPGWNTVEARSTDISGNQSRTIIRKYFRIVPLPLGVVVNGNGTVWPHSDGALLNFGRNYAAVAQPSPGNLFSNWTSGGVVLGTARRLGFTMVSNLVIEANFVPNPFLAARGAYAGLFYDPNQPIVHERSGSFAFALTGRGTYSGRLVSGPRVMFFSGRLNLDGLSTNLVRFGTEWWTIEWSFDLSMSGTNRLGIVRGDGWTAELIGDRRWFNPLTNPSPFAGSYTVAVTGATASAISTIGNGFGNATSYRGGLLRIGAVLPDNSTALSSSFISRNGEAPLYVRLFGGRGSLLGWVAVRGTNGTPAIESRLSWMRPVLPLPTGRLYPNGFVTDATLTGSLYQRPIPNTNQVVQIENGQVVFDGGNLAAAFTNYVTLSPNNRVSNDLSLSPNPLTMTINLLNGRFYGQVQVPGTSQWIPFRGALLQDANLGLGFFVGADSTGEVRFETAQ